MKIGQARSGEARRGVVRQGSARRGEGLLADMSAAWEACNTALQQLDAAAHKQPFGAGRRRAQSAARRIALPDPDREEARMIAEMNGYLDSVG